MRRVVVAVVSFSLCVGLMVGCNGPLSAPLPARLSDQNQKSADEVWTAALTPINKYDRQTWLDAFVLVKVYEYGAELVTFRSEKKWSGGKVVMEVHFERAKAEDDRFEMTVYDHAGKVLRKERYSRGDVEQTIQDLLVNKVVPEPQEVKARRDARDARLKRLEEMFTVPEKPDAPK